jgi:hypothetical protein
MEERMESIQRENRILRIAVVILVCIVLAGAAATGAQQSQRLPGPGSGIVDVRVLEGASVAAAQQGEWRVGQQGEWRVGVQGAVATLPAMPRIIRVGGVYAVRGPSLEMVATVRELHESGWARVSDELKQEYWINLAAMSSIQVR